MRRYRPVSHSRAFLSRDRDSSFYFGVAGPCLVGLVLANIVTTVLRLQRPERVAVSIECCYQNVGIATSVALSMVRSTVRRMDPLNDAISPFLLLCSSTVSIRPRPWLFHFTTAAVKDCFC
jgi:hypothetical protein